MAINNQSITSPTIGSTGTTTRTVNVSCNETVSGRTYKAEVKINGSSTVFKSGSIVASGPSINISMSYTDNELLTALNGASSLGWSALIKEYDGTILLDQNILTSKTATASITIGSALRYGSVAHSNPPYDLDGTGQIIAVASRPSSHAGWRVRYQFYVNNTLAFSRGFFSSSNDTTTLTFTPTAEEKAALLNAMGGVSPRTMQVRAVTGWNLSGGTTTLSGTNSSSQTNNLIKLFSSIKVRLAGVWTGKPIKVRVAGVWKNAIVKVWTGSSWKQAK